MAITNFIPEIWSAAVLEALQEQAVIAPLVNRDYEGEVRRGNKVNITGVVVPTVKDYATGENGNPRTTSAEALSEDADSLTIDQEKAFDFYVDDIDRVQAAGSFDAWTTAAGRALANDADAFIAARMFLQGTALQTSISDIFGTPSVTPGDAAHRVIRDANKAMNKANIPDGERVAFINAEFEAALLDAESKITSFDTSGDTMGLRNATIGRYLGFRIVRSNLLPVIDAPAAVFVWQPSVAYVSQINETEALRHHEKFADRIRGLHVYGAKVIDVDNYPQGVQVYAEAES
ncbi:MAG UNVERIFIED_CONTAM: phage capsid protein [Thermobifida fusca]